MQPGSGRTFYAADLAYVHDAGFLGFANRAAPGVLQLLRRHCRPGARVVEIGCGSGGLTQHLVRAGYRMLGVDVAPAMIRLARHRVPGAEFRVASYHDFALPPCAAVVAVGECLNYLAAGRSRHEAALGHFFRRAGAALPPGGLLLFDFLEPCAGRPRTRNAEASGADWLVHHPADHHHQVGRRAAAAVIRNSSAVCAAPAGSETGAGRGGIRRRVSPGLRPANPWPGKDGGRGHPPGRLKCLAGFRGRR
jgi:SAM-dependent methyltransferase